MSRTTYRDWQPGDGITCAHAGNAPREIPCGRPVRTGLITTNNAGGRDYVKTRALCANHADLGINPGQIMLAARKAAQERLISEHWDEYQTYLREVIDEMRALGGVS